MLHPFTAPPIHPYVAFPFISIIIPITMQAGPFLLTFAAHCGHLCYTRSNIHIFNNINDTAVVQWLQAKFTMPCSAHGILCNRGSWGKRGVTLILTDFSLALASFSKSWYTQGLRGQTDTIQNQQAEATSFFSQNKGTFGFRLNGEVEIPKTSASQTVTFPGLTVAKQPRTERTTRT